MNDIMTYILLGIGIATGCLVTLYLVLCGFCWMQDVFDESTWRRK